MKITKYLGYLLMLLGACAAAVTVWVSVSNLDAQPVLRSQSEAAHKRVVTMMDDFCRGDYASAQKALHGQTRLGADRTAEDPVGAAIWEAFRSSMTYEMVGQQYATNDGLAQNIRITTLDMNALTDYVEANAKSVLDQRVNEHLEAQKGLDDVYDEEGQYRDEFVSQILLETAQQAVEKETGTVQTELTLTLVWEDGLWWIVPNDQLLGAVSGGIVG